MDFKTYLFESYKIKELEDLEEAENIIREKCSGMSIFDALWRGMRGDSNCYILNGESGSRKSINTTNYYTQIIDHFIKKEGPEYPLRSKSIICGTYPMKEYLHTYGPKTYAIFPFDDVKIGLLPTHDIWRLSSDTNNKYRMLKLNNVFEENGLSQDSYESFLNSLKSFIKNYKEDDSLPSSSENEIIDIFGKDVDKIESRLEDLYGIDSLRIKFITNESLNDLKDESRELWISGKCVAIEKDAYENMLRMI